MKTFEPIKKKYYQLTACIKLIHTFKNHITRKFIVNHYYQKIFFKHIWLIVVVDLSHQNDNVISSNIDLRVKFEWTQLFQKRLYLIEVKLLM